MGQYHAGKLGPCTAPAAGSDEVPSHALEELSQASVEDWASRSPSQAEQPQRGLAEVREDLLCKLHCLIFSVTQCSKICSCDTLRAIFSDFKKLRGLCGVIVWYP